MKLALVLSPDGSGEFILSDDLPIGTTMQKFIVEMEKLGVIIESEHAIKEFRNAVNPMFLCG